MVSIDVNPPFRTMKPTLIPLAIVLTVSALLFSCNDNRSDGDIATRDSVTVQQQRLSDTSTFVKSNGEHCVICADMNAEVPVAFGDTAATAQLQRLFVRLVLEQGDSLPIDAAMQQCVSNSIHQFDMVGQTGSDDEEDTDADVETLHTYNTSTTITTYYNKNDLVTFCRADVVKKNDQVTSVAHRYVTIDLTDVTPLELNRMFRDDAIGDVCQLLKNALLSENKATSNEQLNELGYYNIDNITVTRNLYFTDQGVTWSFLPNELAVEAIGEPHITIPYDELKPMACDNSVLDRVK